VKVVVSPILVSTTPTSSVNDSVEKIYSSTPPLTTIPHKRRRVLDFDDESDNLDLPESETDAVPESEVSSTPSSTNSKKKIMKTEDDKVPLPDPFPLPKRFRPEVERSLKEGVMSNNSRSHFLSAVASAMLTYKMYPTKDDYTCVARTIVRNYPFLKAPPGAGLPHVS
jgi:hypothetical protein